MSDTTTIEQQAFNALDAAACALAVLTNDAEYTHNDTLATSLSDTLAQLETLAEHYRQA